MLARAQLEAQLYPYDRGDVRHSSTPDEEIEDLKTATLDQVRQFHTRFYGGSGSEVVISGRFDPDQARKLVAELLGGWKSSIEYEAVARSYRQSRATERQIRTPHKEAAILVAGLPVQLSETDADYPALVLANYIMGGSGGSRLSRRLREREGLSYAVTSELVTPSAGDGATFSTMFICAPDNMRKAESSYRDELERALKHGFDAEEVMAAKKSLLASRMLGRSHDPWRWDDLLEAGITELKPEEVSAAFRKYIQLAGLVVVKAGDFGKAVNAK